MPAAAVPGPQTGTQPRMRVRRAAGAVCCALCYPVGSGPPPAAPRCRPGEQEPDHTQPAAGIERRGGVAWRGAVGSIHTALTVSQTCLRQLAVSVNFNPAGNGQHIWACSCPSGPQSAAPVWRRAYGVLPDKYHSAPKNHSSQAVTISAPPLPPVQNYTDTVTLLDLQSRPQHS